VDRVLTACGGGRAIVAGQDGSALVRGFRRWGVDAREVSVSDLLTGGSADLVWLEHVLDGCGDSEVDAIARLAQAAGPRALVATVTAPREPWERRFLELGWRKHPQYQELVEYGALDVEAEARLLLQPVPADVSVGCALDDLAATRDLHMDMLRETGRRSDAHVARYELARRFVRPGDRVLDAACGLGYGSRLLADATLAGSVLGVDVDDWAIRYATDHYGRSHGRLSFDVRDLTALDDIEPASFDVIVSFETIEHLAGPEAFLEQCRRLLTPGGRFVCSVPNQWLDEHGVDPNPHHLHVFDRDRLEELCRRHFLLEHVYGQTAGGGMKLPSAGRALWSAADRSDDAEWWLAVGMTDPFAAVDDPVTNRWTPATLTNVPALLSFARDYEHPWLVRALVSIGLRTESPALLEALVERTLAEASPASADRGAALCVRAYRQLAGPEGVSHELLYAIDRYCQDPPANPHVHRWHVSLRYAQGLAWLAAGCRERAVRALSLCAATDPIPFSPLLATKTVSACWFLGWMALQSGDVAVAGRWWRGGLDHAERAVRRPWDELLVDRQSPVLFGLREAALIVDLASQCASGLHLLPHAADRPGIAWAQITESMTIRLERQERAREYEACVAQALQRDADRSWQACQAAEADARRLRSRHASSWILDATSTPGAEPRVAIFGTGAGGRLALERLRARGARIDCFADNDRARWNQTIADLPVVDPATLPSRGVDFIAVASAPGREAIFAQLAALGYRAGRDYDAVT
jgi:SAM-dependent methyltransferase